MEKGMSPQEAQDFLYTKCGLKGLSGVSNDVRELLESPSPGAALALNYFVHRVSLYAGMLAAALGGLDAFVFTAGIGERSVEMRSRIAEKLAWLGAKLSPAANAASKPMIGSDASTVALLIVPTDEELMIAKHTLALLSARGVRNTPYARTA
jgi:acetate kinase